MCMYCVTAQFLWTFLQRHTYFWLSGLLYNGHRVFPGGVRSGRGVVHPPLSSAEVEGRVELYICCPSRPSWPVLGRTLPLPLPFFSSLWLVQIGWFILTCIMAVTSESSFSYIILSFIAFVILESTSLLIIRSFNFNMITLLQGAYILGTANSPFILYMLLLQPLPDVQYKYSNSEALFLVFKINF